MSRFFRSVIAAATVVVFAGSLEAQGLYFGLRGGAGIPTGAFGENSSGSAAALDAAKTGFGYGLDAGLQLGMIGIYGGFDKIKFECESPNCDSDGNYRLKGFAAGIKLIPPGVPRAFQPWIKGGVTFNELQGGFGSGNNELTTDRNPGYEIGAGLDIGFLGFLRFTPQARYVGQNFKYEVPGVNNTATEVEQGANYLTFDLGLQFVNPLSGMRR